MTDETTAAKSEQKVNCSSCRALLILPETAVRAGQRIMCPKCLTPFYPQMTLQPDQLPEPTTSKAIELPLVFHGNAREYFRIWIVNLCLTMVTLGVFSAWAKVRKKRYMYSHTTLDDTPFQYLGMPVPILKGRIIAATGFFAWWITSRFVTSLAPVVLGIGLVAAPWVLVRSAAFNARYSAYRNMTFDFSATYLDGLKILYAWGIIPAVALSIMLPWTFLKVAAGFAALIFGFYFPFWMRNLKGFIVSHMAFGSIKGRFSATGGQFFQVYFFSGLIAVAIVLPVFIIIVIIAMKSRDRSMLTYTSLVPTYIAYLIGYAYVKARATNLSWNHTRIGPLDFQSTLRTRDLIKLYVTNAIGIVASLGLLIPWAVIRTVRYRADHTRVFRDGPMETFMGSESKTVAAAGAETMDFFDLDLAI